MASTTPTSYYPARAEHAENSLERAIETGTITEDDAEIIRLFIQDSRYSDDKSLHHANRMIYHFITLRRFIRRPYRDLSIYDIYSGIEALNTGESQRGRPFKQNTIAEQVYLLIRFLRWMSEEGYSTISPKEIRSIRTFNKKQKSWKNQNS